MIKNLLLVALRNFKRDKWYSLLNILGLTIGITFSLFLIFYIRDELSYDRYHKNADRIYRINGLIKEPDKDMMNLAITPSPLGPTLKKEYPEVEESVRLIGGAATGSETSLYKNGNLSIYEDKIFYCDSTVFKIFTYPFIEGDPRTALTEPNSMVLTQSTADKFFGSHTNIIGKSLQNEKGEIFKITGVTRDVPRNSHLIFNMLISLNSMPKNALEDWGRFGTYTYILLKPHVNVKTFEHKMLSLYDKYLASIFASSNIKIHFEAQPLTAIHLHSKMQFEPEDPGNISYIYIFSAVAFFMLLIACINYMNLTTARSARRAKETGIRKVTGSSRSQLIAQFLVESVLTSIFALLLSLILIALLLPAFNLLAGKSISFEALWNLNTLLFLVAIVLFVGLMGGSYPAFYLSKFNPVDVLKGSLSKSSSNQILRRVLVVIQFSISMIMLICTWIIYEQLSYMKSKDTGFNKEQVLSLSVNTNNDVRGSVSSFKNAIRENPHVLSVSTSEQELGKAVNYLIFSVETKSGYKNQGVSFYGIDENYIKTLGMQIVEGRNFSGASDSFHILVNQNMVKYYGWDNAIGKRIRYGATDTTKPGFEVIGVVKDFNQKSLYDPIIPLFLYYRPNGNKIQVKLAAKDIPSVIAEISKVWKTFFPDLPFSYTFLDQDFNTQYKADENRGKIFTAFSILTIVITCLGLLGLIAYITEQRQKEISIRKIMGAGIKEIIPLITTNFILLVGLSCLIAFPVAYLFMNKWLNAFPYRIGLTIYPFLWSAFIVLLVTLLTVIFHTIKAATANPAKNLRTE